MRSPASAGELPGIGARLRRLTAAHWLVIGVTGLLLLVFAPALVRGGPLADDYIFCLRPIQDGGYGPFLRDIWHDTGVVRPADEPEGERGEPGRTAEGDPGIGVPLIRAG